MFLFIHKTKNIFAVLLLLTIYNNVLLAKYEDPQNPRSNVQRRAMEANRRKLTDEIKTTNTILNTTTAERKATSVQLATLQKQLRNRENLINTIKTELIDTDARMAQAESLIVGLESDMVRLGADYGKMMRAAYRYKRTNSSLLFLFAARGFNDAYRRWQYIHRYNEQRLRQVKVIRSTKQSLEEQKQEMVASRQKKEELLAAEEQNKVALKSEAKEKDDMVRLLSRKETDLRAEMNKMEAAKEKLNVAIENSIRAKVKTEKTVNRTDRAIVMPALTASEKVIDGSFSKNKGRLSAPTEGTIIDHFGTHPHPALPNLKIANNGVTYRAPVGAAVKAVFEGVVHSVNFVSGNEYCVLIEHGGYYTVYAHVNKVSVRKGEKVSTRQVIGSVTSGEMHFEVWRGMLKLNPEIWLQ